MTAHHVGRETLFLPVVHDYDLVPVFSDLGQTEGTAEVDQVEDVLLEARAAKTDGSLEKLGANARIDAN